MEDISDELENILDFTERGTSGKSVAPGDALLHVMSSVWGPERIGAD
jgi:hypothetical protein